MQLELCGLDEISEGINDDTEEDLVSVYVGKENYSISVIGGILAIRNSSGVQVQNITQCASTINYFISI